MVSYSSNWVKGWGKVNRWPEKTLISCKRHIIESSVKSCFKKSYMVSRAVNKMKDLIFLWSVEGVFFNHFNLKTNRNLKKLSVIIKNNKHLGSHLWKFLLISEIWKMIRLAALTVTGKNCLATKLEK